MESGKWKMENFGRDGQALFGKNVRSRPDKYGYNSKTKNLRPPKIVFFRQRKNRSQERRKTAFKTAENQHLIRLRKVRLI